MFNKKNSLIQLIKLLQIHQVYLSQMLINNINLKKFLWQILIVWSCFIVFNFIVLWIQCIFLWSYIDFDVYIVSLLIWTLSSKKFTSIQENTIAVLANLYGELSLRWPALFRIFTIELIDILNGLFIRIVVELFLFLN